MGRFLRFAIVSSLIGAVVGAALRNRDRITSFWKGRPAVDQPGSPPVSPGRYAPEVDFAGYGDDAFTEIKGIGPRTEEQLKAAGITTYEKLADLTPDQVMQVLFNPPPGADYEAWVSQARELAERRRTGQ
ncbi:MAG: hypothetical protein GEU28_13860 [Dehalococcoidia bacterium]|nr:hypothetical protein [Dehalococcoidia bacterium]